MGFQALIEASASNWLLCAKSRVLLSLLHPVSTWLSSWIPKCYQTMCGIPKLSGPTRRPFCQIKRFFIMKFLTNCTNASIGTSSPDSETLLNATRFCGIWRLLEERRRSEEGSLGGGDGWHITYSIFYWRHKHSQEKFSPQIPCQTSWPNHPSPNLSSRF